MSNSSEARAWQRHLTSVGFVAILLGALDPMEGSLLILPGSALVALGSFLCHAKRSVLFFRVWMSILIAVGVGALWGFSALGGVGGEAALSRWWGLLVLPYVVGLSASFWGPGSPRWLLALGLPVALLYLSIAWRVLWAAGGVRPGVETAPIVVVAALGLVTFVGCALRLFQRRSGVPTPRREAA